MFLRAAGDQHVSPFRIPAPCREHALSLDLRRQCGRLLRARTVSLLLSRVRGRGRSAARAIQSALQRTGLGRERGHIRCDGLLHLALSPGASSYAGFYLPFARARRDLSWLVVRHAVSFGDQRPRSRCFWRSGLVGAHRRISFGDAVDRDVAAKIAGKPRSPVLKYYFRLKAGIAPGIAEAASKTAVLQEAAQPFSVDGRGLRRI